MPPVPAPGVPDRTPPEVRETPAGRVPLSVNVGVGTPVVVNEKLLAEPAVKVVLFAFVNTGTIACV